MPSATLSSQLVVASAASATTTTTFVSPKLQHLIDAASSLPAPSPDGLSVVSHTNFRLQAHHTAILQYYATYGDVPTDDMDSGDDSSAPPASASTTTRLAPGEVSVSADGTTPDDATSGGRGQSSSSSAAAAQEGVVLLHTHSAAWAALRTILCTAVDICLSLATDAHKRNPPKVTKTSTADGYSQQTFDEDNEFIRATLAAMPKPPVTLQRLCEIVVSPMEYHTTTTSAATPSGASQGANAFDIFSLDVRTGGGGGSGDQAASGGVSSYLRGEKLQDAIRRCVVIAPI